MHGTDHPHAAVQTRDGPNCNYRRYPAFVSPLSQSSSPFNPRTPACHDAQTALHQIHIHPGRRGCMLVHAHRHLPCIQRPHTRCYSPNTRSLTHSSCLTHTHHTTHTRGGTHPRCLIHTPCLTPTRLFAHTCRLLRARGFFPLRCPFHTRCAGTHALRHTCDHTTHMRGLIHTRGLTHTFHHTHRDHTRNHTHLDHTHAGDSRHLSGSGVSIPPKLRGHPSAALVLSNSSGTTEPTWS